jgi:uncharacterized protein involved in tolerance to divalent cations
MLSLPAAEHAYALA